MGRWEDVGRLSSLNDSEVESIACTSARSNHSQSSSVSSWLADLSVDASDEEETRAEREERIKNTPARAETEIMRLRYLSLKAKEADRMEADRIGLGRVEKRKVRSGTDACGAARRERKRMDRKGKNEVWLTTLASVSLKTPSDIMSSRELDRVIQEKEGTGPGVEGRAEGWDDDFFVACLTELG